MEEIKRYINQDGILMGKDTDFQIGYVVATPEQVIELEANQIHDLIKINAQIELDKTDLVALRCLKAGVKFPLDWQTYTKSLRDIVSGIDTISTTLPIIPSYPAGT